MVVVEIMGRPEPPRRVLEVPEQKAVVMVGEEEGVVDIFLDYVF